MVRARLTMTEGFHRFPRNAPKSWYGASKPVLFFSFPFQATNPSHNYYVPTYLSTEFGNPGSKPSPPSKPLSSPSPCTNVMERRWIAWVE